MKIALHEIEPWLARYQFVRFNLAQSGMQNQTLGELLDAVGVPADSLRSVSLEDSDSRGALPLRQAVAALYGGIDPDSILITTGTSEALLLYFHVRHAEGANVVVPTPAFQNLPEIPRYLKYEVRPVPLSHHDEFRIDVSQLEAAVDERTRAIVVNNPHNPTGMLYSAAEIARIEGAARRVGADVLADEHYRFVPLAGGALLIPSLYRPGGSVVAVGSMIKCFGCVGLRVGWLIGPRPLLDACRDLKDYTTHTVCALNEVLATHALKGWERIMPRYLGWVRRNVEQFQAFVDRYDSVMEWVAPQGGLVAFPRLRLPDVSSQRFAQALVEQAEVFVLPGETFGVPGHLRVGLGLDPDRFSGALRAWGRFIETRGWQ